MTSLALANALREQSKTLVELYEIKEQHDLILRMIGQIELTIDHDGNVLRIGQSWEAVTGQTCQDALFQGWLLVVHPEDIDRVQRDWIEAITTNSSLDLLSRLKGADDTYRWYRLRMVINPPQLMTAPYWYGTFDDVDDRQKAAVRFEQTQSALIHMSRLSAMGTMASTIAHELNQPLSSITNYTRAARRMLEAGRSYAEVSEALDGADKAGVRAGEIVRRVRELVVSGQVDKRSEDLSQVVHEACSLVFINSKVLGVTYEIKADPALKQVMIDRVQIEQVIINILRNSIEAVTTRDERHIKLDLEEFDENSCQLAICDSGPGISQKIADRLFEIVQHFEDNRHRDRAIDLPNDHRGAWRQDLAPAAGSGNLDRLYCVVLARELELLAISCISRTRAVALTDDEAGSLKHLSTISLIYVE